MQRHMEVVWFIAIAILILFVIIGIQWLKVDSSDQPKSLVTTIYGDAQTSRAFTWYTENPQAATVIQLLKVTNSQSFEGSGVRTVTGETTTIETGKSSVQGVHKVKVTELEPGTMYSYRVGSGEEKGWSEPSIFTTETDSNKPLTFINVTDSQGVTEADFTKWAATLDKAFSTFPEARFIVHNGDLTEDPEDEKAWDHFFGKTKKWLTRIPLMPVTGNHDEVDGQADRYTSHFTLPDNGAYGSIPGTMYSFDVGPAHVVVLNTESNLDEQSKWLQKDLESTDKPWKIVAMHRGPYGGNTYKKATKWVPIFEKYGVDLVLQGHNHEYSRSYPLMNGEKVGNGEGAIPSRTGIVYVVTNTAGPKFNEKKEEQFYHKVHFQNQKQMFAGITIDGNTLTFQAYDVDGQKLDEFVLTH
ncbi:Alkaline phosphatase precursor [compost metagenome]